MTNYKKIKHQLLEEKSIRRAYDALGPEFQIIEKMIEKRIKNGITQAALAKKIGTKQSAISRFESGKYNPSLGFLFKIAYALDAELNVTVSSR